MYYSNNRKARFFQSSSNGQNTAPLEPLIKALYQDCNSGLQRENGCEVNILQGSRFGPYAASFNAVPEGASFVTQIYRRPDGSISQIKVTLSPELNRFYPGIDNSDFKQIQEDFRRLLQVLNQSCALSNRNLVIELHPFSLQERLVYPRLSPDPEKTHTTAHIVVHPQLGDVIERPANERVLQHLRACLAGDQRPFQVDRLVAPADFLNTVEFNRALKVLIDELILGLRVDPRPVLPFPPCDTVEARAAELAKLIASGVAEYGSFSIAAPKSRRSGFQDQDAIDRLVQAASINQNLKAAILNYLNSLSTAHIGAFSRDDDLLFNVLAIKGKLELVDELKAGTAIDYKLIFRVAPAVAVPPFQSFQLQILQGRASGDAFSPGGHHVQCIKVVLSPPYLAEILSELHLSPEPSDQSAATNSSRNAEKRAIDRFAETFEQEMKQQINVNNLAQKFDYIRSLRRKQPYLKVVVGLINEAVTGIGRWVTDLMIKRALIEELEGFKGARYFKVHHSAAHHSSVENLKIGVTLDGAATAKAIDLFIPQKSGLAAQLFEARWPPDQWRGIDRLLNWCTEATQDQSVRANPKGRRYELAISVVKDGSLPNGLPFDARVRGFNSLEIRVSETLLASIARKNMDSLLAIQHIRSLLSLYWDEFDGSSPLEATRAGRLGVSPAVRLATVNLLNSIPAPRAGQSYVAPVETPVELVSPATTKRLILDLAESVGRGESGESEAVRIARRRFDPGAVTSFINAFKPEFIDGQNRLRDFEAWLAEIFDRSEHKGLTNMNSYLEALIFDEEVKQAIDQWCERTSVMLTGESNRKAVQYSVQFCDSRNADSNAAEVQVWSLTEDIYEKAAEPPPEWKYDLVIILNQELLREIVLAKKIDGYLLAKLNYIRGILKKSLHPQAPD
jgi:hypothetical protein